MTILLTGGTGFLGSHIAEQLSQAGRPVRALVRSTSDVSFLSTLSKVELVEGDVGDPASLERATLGADAVIHAAGLVKARRKEDFLRTNRGGTEALLNACLATGVKRLVFVSSLTAGGPSKDGRPVGPNDPQTPVTYYGASKRAAEELLLAHRDQLHVTILRPSAIYGPRDREILVFFQALKSGVLPLTSAPKNRISMVSGADCAACCISALDADVPSGCLFCIDDGEVHTMLELIEEAERALGKRAWVRLPLPPAVTLMAAAATEAYGAITNKAVIFTRNKCNELFNEWVSDSSDTRAKLGWTSRISFADGIKETADWYKQAGWL